MQPHVDARGVCSITNLTNQQLAHGFSGQVKKYAKHKCKIVPIQRILRFFIIFLTSSLDSLEYNSQIKSTQTLSDNNHGYLSSNTSRVAAASGERAAAPPCKHPCAAAGGARAARPDPPLLGGPAAPRPARPVSP